jgi:hypothetical protein
MKQLLHCLACLISFSCLAQTSEKYNGFLKNVNGMYFFYEVSGDSLLPSRMAVFTKDTTGLYKTMFAGKKNSNNEAHLSVSGTKPDKKVKHNGHYFNVIAIDSFEPFSLYDFIRNKKNRVIENEEAFETEGYFTRQFESIIYTAIENNTNTWSGWTFFSPELEAIDSLTYILHNWNSRGMYLKIQGIKRYGSPYGYGHFGMSNSKILITKIIAADTTRTYKGFLRDKMLSQGHVVFGKDTVTPVYDFEQGKEYRFSAFDDDYNYKLRIRKVNPVDIEYTFEYYKRKKLKKTISGVLTLNPYSAMSYQLEYMPYYFYESLHEYRFDGESLVKIEMGETDSTTGKRIIIFEEYITGLRMEGALGLTED